MHIFHTSSSYSCFLSCCILFFQSSTDDGTAIFSVVVWIISNKQGSNLFYSFSCSAIQKCLAVCFGNGSVHQLLYSGILSLTKKCPSWFSMHNGTLSCYTRFRLFCMSHCTLQVVQLNQHPLTFGWV